MQNWPKIDLDSLKDYDMCFGCGKANPIGLKLQFSWDERTQTAGADFTPGENLQGWAGYLHGGITACVLDEAMGWVALFTGNSNVTAKMQVRYKQMVPVGNTYRVSCTISKQTPRLIETAATLTGMDGTIYAEATSVQFVVGPQRGEQT
ncbi:MAG: PaaI family thioesterase [Dehalococcoidales bacterium]|nr:PaaI family thioesterase [Dehalococcoidales bacterium]